MYVRFTSNRKYFYPFKEITKIRIIARPIQLSKKKEWLIARRSLFPQIAQEIYWLWKLVITKGENTVDIQCLLQPPQNAKPLLYLSFSSFSNFKMIWIPLYFAPKKSLVVSQDIMWKRSITMLRLVTEKTDLMVLIPQKTEMLKLISAVFPTSSTLIFDWHYFQ